MALTVKKYTLNKDASSNVWREHRSIENVSEEKVHDVLKNEKSDRNGAEYRYDILEGQMLIGQIFTINCNLFD